jgi:flagellar hook-length control protein FliK
MIQPNPSPGLPRLVDSGQLRVTSNSSELKISVQLPELGKVEVRAVTAHDVTTAHLTTFRHDALQVLSTGRTDLAEALKSRDVVLGSLNAHAQGQSDSQQRQQDRQSSVQPSGGTVPVTATKAAIAEDGTTGFLPGHSSISVRA